MILPPRSLVLQQIHLIRNKVPQQVYKIVPLTHKLRLKRSDILMADYYLPLTNVSRLERGLILNKERNDFNSVATATESFTVI